MKKFMALILIVVCFMVSACNENMVTRSFGGNMNVNLPAGKKLVTATWKNADLWYLTRDAKPGEKPEVTVFQEQSAMGVAEGRVTFIER